jgi:hypothetical protein
MLRSLALAFAAALAAGGLFAPAARAQAFMPPAKVQEAMEKDRSPAVFMFTMEDAVGKNMDWVMQQQIVLDVLEKYHYAACKIAVTDAKSIKPWGGFQKLADEFGITPTTTLVIVSYDRKVLQYFPSSISRDAFAVALSKKAIENNDRIKKSEETNTDLTQIEKWIEEKKLSEAGRRLAPLLKRDRQKLVDEKTKERETELDGKLEAAGKAKLEEAKALLDGGKGADAKPLLEDVATLAPKECGKEAKELLKKAKS